MSRQVKDTGFVLIELMLVIAIIAIIAAIAIPNLLRARASANESSAISSLRTLVYSQAFFYHSDIEGTDPNDYATSLEELEESGLIDSVLGSGEKSGYLFTLTTSENRQSWEAKGVPGTATGGTRTFFVDQRGDVLSGHCGNGIVEASEQCELGPGQGCSAGNMCLPWSCQCAEMTATSAAAPNGQAALESNLEKLAIGTAQEFNQLAAGVALRNASGLLSHSFGQQVLAGLDNNHDGWLSFREVLSTDILKLARTIAPTVSQSGLSFEGDDNQLQAILYRYLTRVGKELQAAPIDMDDFAGIKISTGSHLGDPVSLTRLVPLPAIHIALGQLEQLVLSLDPDPQAGHSGGSKCARCGNRNILLKKLAGWEQYLLDGDLAGLRSNLAGMRKLAKDTLVGSGLDRVVRQIDLVLKYLADSE